MTLQSDTSSYAKFQSIKWYYYCWRTILTWYQTRRQCLPTASTLHLHYYSTCINSISLNRSRIASSNARDLSIRLFVLRTANIPWRIRNGQRCPFGPVFIQAIIIYLSNHQPVSEAVLPLEPFPWPPLAAIGVSNHGLLLRT